MFNLGMGEITVILVLVLIFVGPKKLPDLASGLGKAIRQIRKTTADVKNEIVLDDTFRKPFEELRDAVTLAPEELKRRDKLMEERPQAGGGASDRAIHGTAPMDGPVTPPPEPIAAETSAPWPATRPAAAGCHRRRRPRPRSGRSHARPRPRRFSRDASGDRRA